MNQVFASGQEGESGGNPEELRIQGLEHQMGELRGLLGELKELLATEEPPARPFRRPQRTRPRTRGGHLPHGVKFYVIGGGILALLAGVMGLPHDNPVKVVVVRTADYLVRQLPDPPAGAAPAVASLTGLPLWSSPVSPSKTDPADPKQALAARPSPSPSMLPLTPGQTVAAVTPATPVSGPDPGTVTVVAASSSSTPPPPVIPASSLPPAPAPPAPAAAPAVIDPVPPPATPAPTAAPTPAPTAAPTPVPTATPTPGPSPTSAPSVLAVPPPSPSPSP